MKIAVFDIGNSRIKWGLATAAGVQRAGVLPHEEARADDFRRLLDTLPKAIESAVASNVAGRRIAADLARAIDEHAGIDLELLHTTAEACGLVNGYEEPERLGVDRWVACVGAWSLYGQSLLVVDAGTATTLDAIGSDGRHLGGLILPGLALMGRALDLNTSDIRTDGSAADDPSPENVFGRSTAQGVRNGSIMAVCGAVESARRVLEGMDAAPRVVLTGGDAPRILRQWHYSIEHRPDLVLEGVAAIVNDR